MPEPVATTATPSFGKIILLNGASSSGKSTLAAALQAELDEPFWHYSIDHLLAAKVLPRARIDAGDFHWKSLRPQFFAGFHATLPALAAAGNNLLVEHIVETADWMSRLLRLLEPHDVFFVGLPARWTSLSAGSGRAEIGGSGKRELTSRSPTASACTTLRSARRIPQM